MREAVKEYIDKHGFAAFATELQSVLMETDEAKLNPEEAEDFSEMLGEFVDTFEDDNDDGDGE